MIKYRADNRWKKIEKIEIERETEKMVFLKGSRHKERESKLTEFSAWFDTFNEAKNWLIDCENKKIEYQKHLLALYEGYKREILGLNEIG